MTRSLRKSVAIFLLFCFALYHFGYYVVYFSFKLQIESQWTDRIYGEMDGLKEHILEIPLTLPYMADEEQFRPTNTTFEKDGQHYRAVKQRYINDTLQIIYVTDSAQKNLDHTIKQWVNALIQDDLPDSGNNTLVAKIFAKDYTQPIHAFEFGGDVDQEKKYIGFIFSTYEDQYLNLHTPPPEFG